MDKAKLNRLYNGRNQAGLIGDCRQLANICGKMETPTFDRWRQVIAKDYGTTTDVIDEYMHELTKPARPQCQYAGCTNTATMNIISQLNVTHVCDDCAPSWTDGKETALQAKARKAGLKIPNHYTVVRIDCKQE